MKLIIKNFQSLKNAEITIEGFTVLVGPSNSGKSAVIRSLKSLITNTRGQDFITQGESAASVTFLVDGHGVAWYKSNSSKYVLDGNVFDKIGSNVPEPVANVLNMSDIEIGSVVENVNVRMQFEGPFFISSTAPARFKLLSYLSGSESISEAIAICNKERLNAIHDCEFSQLQMEQAAVVARKQAEFNQIDEQFKDVVDDYQELSKMIELHKSLSDLAVSYNRASDSFAFCESSFKDADIVLTEVVSLLKDVENEIEALDVVDARAKQFVSLSCNVTSVNSRLVNIENEMASVSAEINDINTYLDSTLSQFTVCPLCGSPIDKESL